MRYLLILCCALTYIGAMLAIASISRTNTVLVALALFVQVSAYFLAARDLKGGANG